MTTPQWTRNTSHAPEPAGSQVQTKVVDFSDPLEFPSFTQNNCVVDFFDLKRVFLVPNMAASAIKTIVSKNKKRHVEDGFNLDLSYIDQRIIAMGFPAEKMESFYRNSLEEVKKFLELKHANHYFIYNLCSERCYDKNKFNGRVASYPFDDHHPPDFSIIGPFCQAVQEWLDKNLENVAVVHCKAGKGRTGVMICCYLLHSGKFNSAREVLDYYGEQRTIDHKGVTIPSQRRYINYYASLIRHKLEYKPVKLYLYSITLEPIPNFVPFSEFYMQFDVKQSNKDKYESENFFVKRSDKRCVLNLAKPLLVCGDVKIEFSSRIKLEILKSKSKEFHFWFNTFFVNEIFSSDLCHNVMEVDPHNLSTVPLGTKLEHNKRLFASPSSNGDHPTLFTHPHNNQNSHQYRLEKPLAPERHSSCVGGANPGLEEEKDATSLTNLMKYSSISDDHLIQDHRLAPQVVISGPMNKIGTSSSSSSASSGASLGVSCSTTTQPSFNNHLSSVNIDSDRRTRHSSVPQTYKSPGAMSHVSHTVYKNSGSNQISTHPVFSAPGVHLSMQLERSQIDKVAKDKTTSKYSENFKVTLNLFRPDDQRDAGTYSSSPVCSVKPSYGKSSPESTSEDETTDSDIISTNLRPQSYQEQILDRTSDQADHQHLFSRRNVFQSDWI